MTYSDITILCFLGCVVLKTEAFRIGFIAKKAAMARKENSMLSSLTLTGKELCINDGFLLNKTKVWNGELGKLVYQKCSR